VELWLENSSDGKIFLATTRANIPPSSSGWSSASGYPLIGHNTHPIAVTVNINPIVLPPSVLVLHPGPNNENAVVRFTAPADGTYRVSGQFYAMDDNATGTTTDVWILPDNSKTGSFSGKVDYYGGAKSVSFTSRVFQLKKAIRWISKSATARIRATSMTPPVWSL
jgi:hypothetical protein